MILAAKRVYVFGFGNSATVCTDMEIRFLRLGLAIRADADSHMQATEAALVTPDDVVIASPTAGRRKSCYSPFRRRKQPVPVSSSLPVTVSPYWPN